MSLEPNGIQVCRLSAASQKSICDHFQRLDLTSRWARFCGAISDEDVLKYAQNIFRHNAVVCGALVEGQLRGVVELRGLFQSWPSTAEAAFSVEPDWQNIGIGDALFERMFAMARNRGVRTIQMICLKENSRMRHLAAKHDAQLHYDQDATEAILRPFWPTPASLMEEIVGETRSYAHRLFE
ncbi:GNAT family N-acetyltransferase [Loktanella sp. Alg231-35]|uniref:GNAT family N-acetyltransferase n=1 Tax=Loktanella sp. Alg231-35 TaxID=1922220 RepID=UPI000D55B496|nr:GNAT family N-acetyltransferase [Loktanella sp. Alg231-35]